MSETDNSIPVAADTTIAAKELLNFIERIEHLEEEKKTISDDIKEVYGEAKGRGYDTKVMKQAIARRKIEREEREQMDGVLETYEQALAEAEAA